LSPPYPIRSPAARRARAAAPLALVALACALVLRDAREEEARVDARPPAPAAETTVAAPPTGETLVVRLEAQAGRALLGTLRLETDDGALVREVEISGAEISVHDVPAGPYVVRAHVAGFARAVRAIRVPSGSVSLTLEPIARVAGQIAGPDGQPASARVRIIGSGIWPARILEAGPDGRFVFEDVPAGVYELEAESGALFAEPRRGLTVAPEASVFVTFHLAEGATLDGRVTDLQTGRPIAGAEVVASAEPLAVSSRAATCDQAGVFQIRPLRPGPISLDVRAPGYVPAIAADCRTGQPCRVELAPGASLRGRVLDADHRPIASAWVEVVGEARDRSPIAVTSVSSAMAALLPPAASAEDATTPATPGPAATPGSVDDLGGLGVTAEVPPLPLVPGEIAADPPAGAMLAASPAASASAPTAVLRTSLRTDEQGEFVVTGLPPGRVEVLARAPGFQVGRTARLQLSPGRERGDVDIVLAPGSRVLGRVLDEHGRPADARLEARIDGDPIPRYLETDTRGEFALEDVGGTVLLAVAAEGHPLVERVVRVDRDETRLDIALEPAARTVRARVVDPHGAPLSGALVRAETLTPGTGQPRTLISDDNGEVELSPAPLADLVLVASHPAFAGTTGIAARDGLTTLTLHAPLVATTSVLDAWTGAAVTDALVTWTCLGAELCSRETTSDASGVVDLLRARPGRYRVEVRAPGYAPLAEELVVRAPRRGELVELPPLALVPGVTLEGDAVDLLGRVVEGVEISIEGEELRDRLVAVTDARGHFRLPGIPAGHHELVAQHPSAGTLRQPLECRRDRDPPPAVLRLPARADAAPSSGDRSGSQLGVALLVRSERGAVVVDRVLGDGPRHAGLLPGDELAAIDGEPASSVEDARARLEGPTLVPALLVVRRDGVETPLRVPRERYALD
jgi:protocatechuate 3,4-dioxygenase beta subunit